MKKILYKLLVLLFVVFITLLTTIIYKESKKEKDNYLLLGNTLNYQLEVTYDDSFASDLIDSAFLVKMINSDCSKQVNDKIVKLSSLIKSNKNIIIYIGKVDVSSFSDDLQVNDRKIRILINNVETIIVTLLKVKKSYNIYLLNVENNDKINQEYEKLRQKYNLGKLTFS